MGKFILVLLCFLLSSSFAKEKIAIWSKWEKVSKTYSNILYRYKVTANKKSRNVCILDFQVWNKSKKNIKFAYGREAFLYNNNGNLERKDYYWIHLIKNSIYTWKNDRYKVAEYNVKYIQDFDSCLYGSIFDFKIKEFQKNELSYTMEIK